MMMAQPEPVVAAAPQYPDPPVIYNVTISKNYQTFKCSISGQCKVTWDPDALYRYVYLVVDGVSYLMSYSSGYYSKTVDGDTVVNPFVSHTVYIKARCSIDWEAFYSSQSTTSTTYYSAITSQSYDPQDKYAIILETTNDDDLYTRPIEYWAQVNAFNDMVNAVDDVFPANNIYSQNMIGVEDPPTMVFLNYLSYWQSVCDSNDFLFIFIVGHGSTSGIKVCGPFVATYLQIDSVLDSYSCSRMVVVIESCGSGAATTFLAETNRLIITAAGTEPAIIHPGTPYSTSYCEFAERFISYVDSNVFFAKAFYDTRKNSYVYSQNPLMSQSLESNLARFGLNCW